MLRRLWRSLLREDRGHGLAEYCLVTAFIVLVALGLYIHISGGVQDLWSTANSTLVSGGAPASGSGTSAAISRH